MIDEHDLELLNELEEELKDYKQEARSIEQDNGLTADWLQKFLEGESVQERATEYCGKCFMKTTVEGGATFGIHRCGQHRTCDFCYQIRRNEFESALNVAVEKFATDMIAVICTEDMAKKLVKSRKTTADDYLRSPLSDDTCIIAISKEVMESVKSFEYLTAIPMTAGDDIDEAIITAFADLPYGKRTSGNLGKPAKKEKNEEKLVAPTSDGDVLELELPRYLIDETDDSLIANLFYKAIVVSSWKGVPKTADDVIEMLEKRFSAFQQLLRENGIEYMIVRRSTKVVSLAHMLANCLVIQEIKPNADITLNKQITLAKQPIARALQEVINEQSDRKRPLDLEIC